MGRGGGGLRGLLVVALVGGWLVSGVMSDGGGRAAFNATSVTDVNDGAINLLMESSSRVFTVQSCVESVTRMKPRENKYLSSFPPKNFVPPGARQWCQCLANDPSGIASIPTPNFFSSSAPKQDFEDAFDRCRASVLEGSDFNTEDICRGMFRLFGTSMGENYVTFCGRICRPLDQEYYYAFYGPSTGLNLYYGCRETCAVETMPGYCAKYKLWYSSWRTSASYRYAFKDRALGVGNSIVGIQSAGDFGFQRRRKIAQDACDALNPLLGSNPNECCNYSRAFEAFQQCCALDSNGKSVFDCEKNFPDDATSLFYDCRANEDVPFSTYGPDYGLGACKKLLSGDASILRDMKVFNRPSTGDTLFEFPDSVIDEFCDEYGEGRCCPLLKFLNIAANCEEDSLLEYVGRTTRPLDGPTPPAGSDDPCFGLCKDGRECVLAGNGSPFCVDCTALLKPKRSGNFAECCQYDADAKKCVTALRNSGPGTCKRTDEIFTRSDDGSTERATFRTSSGFACQNPREFRDNGAACKIEVTSSGARKCFD